MILSFHPIIEADQNIICAGREPGEADLAAIRAAEAVILPQGCAEALYRMARRNCQRVFPNLDVRFDFPGKCGQIQLFDQYGVTHPRTQVFESTAAYHDLSPEIEMPAVVKFDWGGQGDTVFKVAGEDELAAVIGQAKVFESTGQSGFLIQPFIDAGHRSLRVAVIGTRFISYWRIQPPDAPFGTGVAHGAAIDKRSDPNLQAAAVETARLFCCRTGLQMAGFDFIFDETGANAPSGLPLMLEINYYFGRGGLGGSQQFYRILTEEVDKWLMGLGLQD
jgi:ribosomal protein S6--L-glutamate ligase